MPRQPLKVHAINPAMNNGDRNARNTHQPRGQGESLEHFVMRRARGVCANIQSFMREERETIALCAKDDPERSTHRMMWNLHRARYRQRMSQASSLP